MDILQSFFYHVYHKFCNRLSNPICDSSMTEMDHKYIIKLPFVGYASKLFAKKLSSLVFNKFGVKIVVVYKSCKLSSFFSLKDVTPLPLSSKLVYKFNCLRDVNTSYIGETTRPLTERIDEHLSKKKKTAVSQHIQQCEACKRHDFVLHDFEVMKRCRTGGETRILEALLIKRHAPVINRQMHLSGVSFILSVY